MCLLWLCVDVVCLGWVVGFGVCVVGLIVLLRLFVTGFSVVVSGWVPLWCLLLGFFC